MNTLNIKDNSLDVPATANREKPIRYREPKEDASAHPSFVDRDAAAVKINKERRELWPDGVNDGRNAAA